MANSKEEYQLPRRKFTFIVQGYVASMMKLWNELEKNKSLKITNIEVRHAEKESKFIRILKILFGVE